MKQSPRLLTMRGTASEDRIASAKRAYQKPTLVSYGTVQQLTKGQAGTDTEGSSGMAHRV